MGIPSLMKKTIIFIFSILAIIIIVDIILAVNGVKGDTISEVTKFFYKFTGGLFFGFGFLFAHLGWYRNKTYHIIISMIVLVLGIIIFTAIQSKLMIQPIIYIVPGIPLGYIFWPQTKPKGIK